MFSKFILFLLVSSTLAAKNWDYTFVSLDVDVLVDYVSADMTLERISRGDYAMKGNFEVKKDLGSKYKVCFFRKNPN